MFVREVLLPLLVSSGSKKLLALDSTLLNEALRQPFVDKRLNMAIGVLANSDDLTFKLLMDLQISPKSARLSLNDGISFPAVVADVSTNLS